MLDKKEIGSRLKEFLLENFSTINEAAKVLGTTGHNMRSNYFNGKSVPGLKILEKLDELGCDIHWLLTGKTTNEEMKKLRLERDVYKKLYEELLVKIGKARQILDNIEEKKK